MSGIPLEDLRLVTLLGACVCRPKGAAHFTHCPHVNHQSVAYVRIWR